MTTVGPYATTVYQLNEARKRGELLDPVSNPYETEFEFLLKKILQMKTFTAHLQKKKQKKKQ